MPIGWHLPTGLGSGEFGLLSNSLGGYKDSSNVAKIMSSSTTPTSDIMLRRLNHFPYNIIYSGLLASDTYNHVGYSALYWSATYQGGGYDYALYIYYDSPSSIIPGAYSTGSNGLYGGGTIRCVAN